MQGSTGMCFQLWDGLGLGIDNVKKQYYNERMANVQTSAHGFMSKTLFSLIPDDFEKYVFSWGEKHCPPPNYWGIGPQHPFHCKTTKHGNG